MSAIGFDGAAHGRGEAGIEIHRYQHQRGVERTEEHSGGRARERAVRFRERSVAEHAVLVEVVGDGDVEALIEIEQLPGRTVENRETQDGEGKAAEQQFFQHRWIILIPND